MKWFGEQGFSALENAAACAVERVTIAVVFGARWARGASSIAV
jgi:hypothetical protein